MLLTAAWASCPHEGNMVDINYRKVIQLKRMAKIYIIDYCI